MKVQDNALIEQSKLETFAEYVQKHGIFDLFQSMVSKMLIEMPDDPIQFMIDHVSAPKAISIAIASPPSSGVELLAIELAAKIGAVFVSAPALVRAAIIKQNSIGVNCKPYYEAHQPIPSAFLNQLVAERLREHEVLIRGYVLVGYPLSKDQAQFMLQSVNLDVSDEDVITRSTGLLYDPATERLYHSEDDPPPQSVSIQNRLIMRDIDSKAAITQRLARYRADSKSVHELFKPIYRRLFFERGLANELSSNIGLVLSHIGIMPKSKAPDMFKLVICGSNPVKSGQVAENIQDKYGCVHVSARKVILELGSSKDAMFEKLAKYATCPESAPLELIGPAIVNRLKQSDCARKGWVLEDFPLTKEQIAFLKTENINPSRVIWLENSQDIRYSINNEIPKTNLESSYIKRTTETPTGIVYSLQISNTNLEQVMEKIDSSIQRPVPFDLTQKV